MSYTQPPPPPGFPPHPSPPAPRPSWARKRVLIPAVAVILLVGAGIGSAGNGGDGEKTAAAPRPTVTVTEKARAADEAEPAPTVTVTKTATAKAKAKAKPKADTAEDAEAADTGAEGKAVFKVWGSAPSGVDITYGNDGTNLQGKGLPMKKTLTVKDDALYYQVTAQLLGGGDIQCSITIDGKTKSGRAQGDYNICSAQLNSDFSGGFS
ncbi:hypothetical protein ABT116_23390 [Streptomyces sp. NPDC002130]|uniref:hypothetical protein n=1 Tax=Streptomyces sp. NPDC002130 TaxID=3155568 RepID=UPI00332E506B